MTLCSLPCSYCYQCQSQVPPRSRHCSTCRVCILRRDHHCLLLGRCVGFHNYRPFLGLLLHATGVLLHVSVLLGPALSALLRAHTPLHTAALLLLPWLMLLTGRNLGGLHGEAEAREVGQSGREKGFPAGFSSSALGTHSQCQIWGGGGQPGIQLVR